VYLGRGRDELRLTADAPVRVLLLGGEPFDEILMWWNFVARTRDEMERAYRDWMEHSDRFGDVRTDLARIDAPQPSWMASGA
jgi:redox-sensitive bicupin YhaK (pirin superfamily)